MLTDDESVKREILRNSRKLDEKRAIEHWELINRIKRNKEKKNQMKDVISWLSRKKRNTWKKQFMKKTSMVGMGCHTEIF